jgi:hypothetical protein
MSGMRERDCFIAMQDASRIEGRWMVERFMAVKAVSQREEGREDGSDAAIREELKHRAWTTIYGEEGDSSEQAIGGGDGCMRSGKSQRPIRVTQT